MLNFTVTSNVIKRDASPVTRMVSDYFNIKIFHAFKYRRTFKGQGLLLYHS